MSKTGIFTFALCKQRSAINYHNSDELELVFPGKERVDIQKLIDQDMTQYIALVNMLRVGDVVRVQPERLNYRFLNSDDEPISTDVMNVVDIQSSVTIFKNNVDCGGSDIDLRNVDSVVPMKQYADMDLTKMIKKDPTFTVSGNVRSVINVVVKPLNSSSRYVFALRPGLSIDILRRLKVGGVVNGKTISKLSANYTMIENDKHWKYVQANIGEFRSLVTNTHRVNYVTDDGKLLTDEDLMDVCAVCVDDSIKHKTCLCDDSRRTILGA